MTKGGKWLIGGAVAFGLGLALAPILIIGLVLTLMIGPLAREKAFEDRNFDYCDVARNSSNSLPEDDPDPFWCHPDIYCPVYEAKLVESDIKAVDITRTKTVIEQVTKTVTVMTPVEVTTTVPRRSGSTRPGSAISDFRQTSTLSNRTTTITTIQYQPVETEVTEDVPREVVYTPEESELTSDEILTARMYRIKKTYPTTLGKPWSEFTDYDTDFFPELCDHYDNLVFTMLDGWAGGEIGMALAALPKSPITNISTAGTRPITIAFAEAIKAKFGLPITSLTAGHSIMTSKGTISDHSRGLAIDVGVSGPLGYDVMGWVWQAHKEGIIGISYTIYNRQIFYAKNGFQPQPYSCNGTPSDCHTNHVHISLLG